MAKVQTFDLRERFSMVVVFRRANWREERVMPVVKRPKRAALGERILVGVVGAGDGFGLTELGLRQNGHFDGRPRCCCDQPDALLMTLGQASLP